MPVAIEVGIILHLEDLVTVRVNSDTLFPCRSQVFHKGDGGVAVGRSKVLV